MTTTAAGSALSARGLASMLHARLARVERLAGELTAELSDLAAQFAVASEDSADGPALLSVEEAAHVLGLGRTTAFLLVREGRLASIKVGSRRLVPRQAIDEFVASSLEAPGSGLEEI